MIKYLFIFSVSLLILMGNTAFAQTSSGGYMEDNGSSLWQQDSFADPNDTDSALDTNSNEYVGEDEVQAFQDAARSAQGPGMDLAAALEKDKQYLPDNIMYGLGTGLTIGGWFALLQGSSARENTRYIGLGLVGGALLGIAIGTKSVYAYKLQQAFNFTPPSNDPILNEPFQPTSFQNQSPSLALLSHSWNF
ncbi:MAG: hypothetical protein QNL04_11895 [SAR324 cluster bacterium]|nr:hypothetical protein [SAR324 cluster bacterium]